ncbi:hypothetical protein [Homoserinimonas hongtaonis]|uniref:Acetone carboxylase n=1 Tax=Homoserinimonas hongtaonis TaxID=2079791 RepID=A0A2U1SYG7_9MICO|nr:hypothetical protein [Salinibacterium hongtaonis]PWB96667.1 hypothetical protein DF220_01555 [Salinibacterium hongtaonis]
MTGAAGGIFGGLGEAGPPEPTCSRAGCRAVATAAVNWRNPKIHGPERVKVWLACDEHTEFLREYLRARDFPVLVGPVGHVPDAGAVTA